nr:MAG TPA: hypothetical protein [Bacteriophage sp.]DAV16020.1 MAG TPA: hypothetical protein [Caudoviricetes sp.]
MFFSFSILILDFFSTPRSSFPFSKQSLAFPYQGEAVRFLFIAFFSLPYQLSAVRSLSVSYLFNAIPFLLLSYLSMLIYCISKPC